MHDLDEAITADLCSAYQSMSLRRRRGPAYHFFRVEICESFVFGFDGSLQKAILKAFVSVILWVSRLTVVCRIFSDILTLPFLIFQEAPLICTTPVSATSPNARRSSARVPGLEAN